MDNQNLNKNLDENGAQLPQEAEKLQESEKNPAEQSQNEKKKKGRKSNYSGIVWLTAVILLIFILLTAALVFSILNGFTLKEAPPRIEIDIEINAGLPWGMGDHGGTTETTPGETTPPATTPGETTPPETTPSETNPPETTPGETITTTPLETTGTQVTERPIRPNVDVVDSNAYWSGDTVVEIFRASYENESGVLTVRSAFNDKVIAPGTANSYYFDIKNTGNVGVDYTVQTFAELTSEVSGKSFLIPLEVRFYRMGGDYMLGSEQDYESMYEINGLKQQGELGKNRYARYVLDWQWPFEGNDELDTMLGNLAAEGGEIRVALRLLVTATMNDSARGGTIIGK